MVGGLRLAGEAMNNSARRHDVIANNLANVSTVGFAREETFQRKLVKVEADPFAPPEVFTRSDFRPGPPVLTDRPLDLTLEGAGFFTLQAEDGGLVYSRVGSIRKDGDGFLRSEGLPILGENGIVFADEREVTIEKDGSILLDGNLVDRLRFTTFRRDEDLVRLPNNRFRARSGVRPDDRMPLPTVHHGQLEGSGAHPISELVRMITAQRSYEAAASAVRVTNETLDRAVNDIARV